MFKKTWIFMLVLMLSILAACSNNDNNLETELLSLDVEFELPEHVEVGETILLEATVTQGDELIKDAEEVNFEYWEEGNEDDRITIDSTNNDDGTYTAEVSLDHDGIFTMYAHVTARSLHTMPKRSVTVGEGTPYEGDHDDHESAEGFNIHFMDPQDVVIDEDTELIVHLLLDDEAFTDAHVRYEIWNDDISDKHDWVDAEETTDGEYTATHTFAEPGTYTIQIHVEDDDDLHEHEDHEIVVSE